VMGYGEVIKFILEFSEKFWENKNVVGEKAMKKVGFIFADTIIPTWWTQAPAENPILTGWFGGPKVRQYKESTDEGLMQLAIDSLSKIFHIDHAVLVEKMVAGRVFNWAKDDFSLGGYAYESLNRKKFLKVLSIPEEDTLFFSGEALEKQSTKLGTVEAALASGLSTGEQVLKLLSKEVIH
jgi:monoamine oxidase